MNLAIDIGNSFVKLGLFDENTIIEKKIFPSNDLKKLIAQLNQYDFKKRIISSVRHTEKELNSIFGKHFLILTAQTQIPITLEYNSPETLGVDRIANAVGAFVKSPGKPVLAVDCGTCITLDLIDESGIFLGGSISTGVSMQFESLHNYTARLPLINEITMFYGPGKSTEESIRAGVLHGTVCSLDGLIDFYRTKYAELDVILTGGDADFFAKALKNTIFADPNLTLKGLNAILQHQNT